MGQIVKVTCTACGKSGELKIGGGKADCDFDVIISGMSELQKENLTEMMHEGARGFTVNRAPCMCQTCGSYYAGNKVSYFFEGEKKIAWSKCPSCGSFKKKIINKDNMTPCIDRKCKGTITLEQTGLWD